MKYLASLVLVCLLSTSGYSCERQPVRNLVKGVVSVPVKVGQRLVEVRPVLTVAKKVAVLPKRVVNAVRCSRCN